MIADTLLKKTACLGIGVFSFAALTKAGQATLISKSVTDFRIKKFIKSLIPMGLGAFCLQSMREIIFDNAIPTIRTSTNGHQLARVGFWAPVGLSIFLYGVKYSYDWIMDEWFQLYRGKPLE